MDEHERDATGADADGAASSGELEVLDGAALRRWAFRARAALAAHRPGIDALNVFPVPDGDTGTNMLQTLSGALRGLREHIAAHPDVPPVSSGAPAADIPVADTSAADNPAVGPAQEPNDEHDAHAVAVDSRLAALSDSTLVAARGNSGAILSELIRGLVATLMHARGRVDATGLAKALRTASERAWGAVGRPVEGTMLSVARSAASAADRSAAGGGRLADVTGAAVEAAEAALARTPEQLPTLKRAGVVDAGGAGLVVVLSALHEVVTGRRAGELTGDPGDVPARCEHGDHPLGDQVEVTYLVAGLDEAARDRLRAQLAELGDSVVLAGDECALRVHVHVEAQRVQQAIDAGGGSQALSHLRIEGLPQAQPLAPTGGSGFVTVLSAGLPESLAGLPGRHLLAGAVDTAHEPDPAGLFAALTDAPASPIVVLTDVAASVEQPVLEARRDGVEVLVVAASALPAAVAALAVHDPHAQAHGDAQAMQAAADAVLCASVSDEPAPDEIAPGELAPGELAAPERLRRNALAQVQRLVERGGGEAELVTICARPSAVAVAQQIADELAAGAGGHRALEVQVVLVGEQAADPLTIGVE